MTAYKQNAATGEVPVVDGQFVHPVSGASVKLHPGDRIFKHSSVVAWLIVHLASVEHADGLATYVGVKGKPMKASSYTLKSLAAGNFVLKMEIPAPAFNKIATHEPWMPVNNTADYYKAQEKVVEHLYKIDNFSHVYAKQEELARDVATLKLAEIWASGVQAGNKATTIKALRQGIEVLLALMDIKERIPTDDIAVLSTEYQILVKKASIENIGAYFPISVKKYLKVVSKDIQEREFAIVLSIYNLDWDNLSLPQIQEFATQQGMQYAEGLKTEALGKDWLAAYLKAPWLLEGDLQAHLHAAELRAERYVKHCAIKAAVEKKYLNKEASPAPLTVEPTNNSIFTDNMKSLGLPINKPSALSPAQLSTAIKKRGGNYVGKMDATIKRKWLVWWAAGFPTATYSIEMQAVEKSTNTSVHVAAKKNPGSPESAQGKQALQAFSDKIASLPDGEYLLALLTTEFSWVHKTKLSPTQISSLVDVLGLAPLKNYYSYSDFPVLQRFWSLHWKVLPKKPSAGVVAAKEQSDPVPAGLDPAAWYLVKGLAANDKELTGLVTDFLATFEPLLNPGDYIVHSGSFEGNDRLKFLPLSTEFLSYWARSTMAFGEIFDYSTWGNAVHTAVSHGITHGLFQSEKPQKWAHGVTEYAIPAGVQVFDVGTGKLYFRHPNNKIILSSIPGSTVVSFKVLPPDSSFAKKLIQGASNGKKVFEGHFKPTYEMMHKDLSHVSLESWELLAEVEQAADYKSALPTNMGGYVQADSLIAVKYLEGKYQALSDNVANFPPGVLKFIHFSLLHSDTSRLDLVLWKLDKGVFPAVVKPVEPELASVGPVLSKTSETLPGMHSKIVWADAQGNKWMSKAFGSDPNAKARVEAEHYSNVIARLHGFKAPETHLMTLEGVYSYVQFLKPAKSDLSGVKWSQLTETQLIQAMSEHPLDWLVSNHDSNEHNLMIDTEGNVFGIDKGQAFRFFGSDQYAPGYLPPTNPIAVWYDQFYSALADGKVKKPLADKVVGAVLARAAQMQSRNDVRHRELLKLAVANRKSWPAGFSNAEKFVAGLMKRKASLLVDTENLYKELYSEAGWKWHFDVSSFLAAQLDEHVHVAPSEVFIEEVKKSGTSGKALFFDSAALEDSHILVYVEKSPKGKLVLRGEAKLRADADAVVSLWLKNQLIVDSSSLASLNFSGESEDDEDDPYEEDSYDLPGNSNIYGTLVMYAKTVSSHAHGNGDYNNSTINSAAQMVAGLKKGKLAVVAAMNAASKSGTPKTALPFGGKIEGVHQHKQWFAMANYYLEKFDFVAAALAVNKKVKELHPDQVPFTKWVYEELGEEETSPDLVVEEAPAEPQEPAEASSEAAVVSGTGLVLKVFKRNSTGTYGEFDPKTGILSHKHGELQDPYKGFEYDVEAENGSILIEYRPWSEKYVPKSQQGLLRFSVQNWSGSKDQLEIVLDILQSMGVEMAPANEISMRIFYWKHLYNILRERSDRGSSKWSKTLNSIQKAYKSKPDMAPQEELEMLEKAWAESIGGKKVEKAPWLPKFGHGILSLAKEGFSSGKPYWHRPDYTLADLHKMHGGHLPMHGVQNFADRLVKMLQSGGLYSTEERVRLLGSWISGTSSSADQGKGSANFLFTRQNHSYHSSSTIRLHPSVLLRTSNYAFNEDHFGALQYRKSESPFSPEEFSQFYGSSNELMIKNNIEVLGGWGFVILESEQLRQKALKVFADAGIKELYGIPIGELFVTNGTGLAGVQEKLWNSALAAEKGK